MKTIRGAGPAICLVAAIGLVSGCTAAPSVVTPTPSASPTPLGADPCDAAVLADAIGAIADVEGYRFVQDFGVLRPPRRVGGERSWTNTRTEGAYLAPDLYRERVVSTTDPLPFTGFWEAIAIGEDAWFLHSSDLDGRREWMETELSGRGRNPLLGAEGYLAGPAGAALRPAEGHPMLPGEGGCVMVAAAPGEQADEATVGIRLDAAARRVASFFVEGDGTRWTIQVQYEVPAILEFQRPADVDGAE